MNFQGIQPISCTSGLLSPYSKRILKQRIIPQLISPFQQSTLLVNMFIGQTIANTMNQQNTSQSDYQLQLYVDQVMRKYDANRNGILEPDEISWFFNDLFSQYGINKRINQWEATNFMRKVDTNFDGKANKYQLFRAFKAMMSSGGGFGSTGNAYASEWSPNFGGYVQPTQVSPAVNYYGAATSYNPYGGYGAVGYTAPVTYNTFGGYGGYRAW